MADAINSPTKFANALFNARIEPIEARALIEMKFSVNHGDRAMAMESYADIQLAQRVREAHDPEFALKRLMDFSRQYSVDRSTFER